MNNVEKLLAENKAWSQEVKERDPDYFQRMAKSQTPEFLWIGCADSRVSADIIMNLSPGELFVQRNIANQVITTDFNCLSVIQYAVQVLKVKHVIVCGHYKCGGIRAALEPFNPTLELTNKWLKHIKDVYRIHRNEIDKLETMDQRAARLAELNVIEQVRNVCHLSIIQNAWQQENGPTIHGWIFDIANGLLEQLVTIAPGWDIDPIYRSLDAATVKLEAKDHLKTL
jgi:carbonic anhydrase